MYKRAIAIREKRSGWSTRLSASVSTVFRRSITPNAATPSRAYDKARGKVGTDRNIGAKHIIVAQDFVERRGIEAGQYGFT